MSDRWFVAYQGYREDVIVDEHGRAHIPTGPHYTDKRGRSHLAEVHREPPVIPAEPGWYAVFVIDNGAIGVNGERGTSEERPIHRLPIIAWEVGEWDAFYVVESDPRVGGGVVVRIEQDHPRDNNVELIRLCHPDRAPEPADLAEQHDAVDWDKVT